MEKTEQDKQYVHPARRKRIEETAKTLVAGMMPSSYKSIRIFEANLSQKVPVVPVMLRIAFEVAEQFVDAFDDWFYDKEKNGKDGV